jgi:hypothetical protein
VRRLTPLATLGLWSALAVVVQRWASIADGIREQFAFDVTYYQVIARAAPSFPDEHVLRPYAERFSAHWVVGSVSDLTGASLENSYRVASVLLVAAMLVATHAAIRSLGLPADRHAVALGLLAASAYPLHYLLAAPGMIADALFLVGLAVMLLGFVRGRYVLVLGGIALATLGRQTAVPVALVAAIWVFAAPAWRPRRVPAAAGVLVVTGAVYLVLRTIGDGFADPEVGDLNDLTVIGFLASPSLFAEHVAKTAVGFVVPAALVAGLWWRTRARLPRGPLLVAAVIVAQPFLLGPASNGDNEPRLAALAVPALALAAAALLAHVRLSARETGVLIGALVVAGLHPRYTWPPPYDSAVWAVLVAIAAVVVLATSARPEPATGGGRRSGRG